MPQSAHLVSKALEEGGLQLGHKWLEPWASLGNEQAYGVQQSCLDLPRQPVTNDPDHGPWIQDSASAAAQETAACTRTKAIHHASKHALNHE